MKKVWLPLWLCFLDTMDENTSGYLSDTVSRPRWMKTSTITYLRLLPGNDGVCFQARWMKTSAVTSLRLLPGFDGWKTGPVTFLRQFAATMYANKCGYLFETVSRPWWMKTRQQLPLWVCFPATIDINNWSYHSDSVIRPRCLKTSLATFLRLLPGSILDCCPGLICEKSKSGYLILNS